MTGKLNIIALLLLFTVTGVAQTNLVTNPGFEDSVSVGWWLNAWGGATGILENETGSNVISGNVSAKVTVTKVGDKIEKISLMSSIVNAPEGELILTVVARTESAMFVPFKLSLKCQSSDGSKKWYGGDEVLLTTAPQRIKFIVTPDPAYRDSIFVRLSCGLNKTTYIFDDVELRKNVQLPLPIPTGRRLKEIVADKYPDGNLYIGGAMLSNVWETYSEEILNNEFSYVTPANDFKQTYIHPKPDIYQWDLSDTWVEKAKTNGQVIRMHSPISPQCSKWAKDDSRTAEELLQNLEEYVTALCQRYNDKDNILWMDVVNETIDKTTGEWFGPKPGTDSWENPWTIIGFDTTYSENFQPPLYIKRAFELANKYAPNIKQIINQHGTMNDAAWDKIKLLVKYLRDKGLRVDGIGFQAHVDVGWENETNDNGINNIVALGNLIDWAHENNLEFHITENNVFLRNGNEWKWEEQANTFQAILQTLISKRQSGVVTWNVWMIRDCDGNMSSANPVLFKEDGSAKPAYYAVQKVLEDGATAVENFEQLPVVFSLEQNFPNPFNPTTTIKYSIPAELHNGIMVQLKVYDILGREVATLVNKKQNAGFYNVQFDASNLSTGVYVYRLQAGNYIASKKLLLLK